MLDKRDKEILSHPSDTRKEDKKTHISYTDKMWPRGDIPYEITFTGIKAGNKGRYYVIALSAACFDALRTSHGRNIQFTANFECPYIMYCIA